MLVIFVFAFVGVVANKPDANPEVHLNPRHIEVIGDNTNKHVSVLVKRVPFATVQHVDKY